MWYLSFNFVTCMNVLYLSRVRNIYFINIKIYKLILIFPIINFLYLFSNKGKKRIECTIYLKPNTKEGTQLKTNYNMKIGHIQKTHHERSTIFILKKIHRQILTNNIKQLRLRCSSRRVSPSYFFDQVGLKTCM